MITETIKIRDFVRTDARADATARNTPRAGGKKRDQGNTDKMRKDKWPRENGA